MPQLVSALQSQSIESALTELVMNCPELQMLEAQRSRFNIFKVLRADRNELRHSNMLAWLFTPDENHGLDDLFLRRWLMIVLKRASEAGHATGSISPIEVDVLDVDRVEVHREFENIDLLFAIHLQRGRPWIVCIENKVDSRQSKGQLARYHEIVENRFPDVAHRIYVFLTSGRETPEHSSFVESSYQDVLDVLTQCMAERDESIGLEPRLLIQHYRALLMDDFMEDSQATDLARQIYLRHRRALDFIFENKVDPIFEATEALKSVLEREQARLGITMTRTNKGYVRFIPLQWNVLKNLAGTSWGPNSPYLFCEIYLWGKKAELQMTAGKAPELWADKIWEYATKTPFKREWKTRPKSFIKPFKAKSDISVDDLSELSSDDIGITLLAWLEKEFATDRYKQAVEILARLLDELPTE